MRTRNLAGAAMISLAVFLIVLSMLPIALFLEELNTVPAALYRLNIEMLNPSYTSRLRVLGRATHLYDGRVSRPRAIELASKPNSTFVLKASCGDLTSYTPLSAEEFDQANPIRTENRTVYLEMRASKVASVLVSGAQEKEKVNFFLVANETVVPLCSKVRSPSPLPTPDRLRVDPVFEGKAFQVTRLLDFAETHDHATYGTEWSPGGNFPSGYSIDGMVRLSTSSLATLTDSPVQDPCTSGWVGTGWVQNAAVDGRDALRHEISGLTSTSDQTDSVYKEFSVPPYDPSLISDVVLCWDHKRADSIYTFTDGLSNRGEAFPSANWGLHRYNLGGDSNADIYYEGQTSAFFNAYLRYYSSSAYTDYSVGRTHGGLAVDLSGGKVAVFGSALLYEGGRSNSGGEDAFYISFGFTRGGTNYWIVYVWKINQDLDPAHWFMADSPDTKWVVMGTGTTSARFNLNGRNICDDIKSKFGWEDTSGCSIFEVKCDSRSKPQQNNFPCLINARFDHIHIIPYSETQGAEVVYVQSAGGGGTYASSMFHGQDTGNEGWTTHSLSLPSSMWSGLCGSTVRVRFDATHKAQQFECDQDDGASGATAGNGRAGNSVSRFFYDNIYLKVTFDKTRLTLNEQPSWSLVWTSQNSSTPADRPYKSGSIQVKGCSANLRVDCTLRSTANTTSHTIQIGAPGEQPQHAIELGLDPHVGGSSCSNPRTYMAGLPEDYFDSPITVLCPEPSQHDVSSSCAADRSTGKLLIPASVFSGHGFGKYTVKLQSPNYITGVKTQWSSNGVYYDEDYFNPNEQKRVSIAIRSAAPGILTWQINGSLGSSLENMLSISSTSFSFETPIGDTLGQWTIGVKYLSSDRTEAGFEAHSYFITSLRLDWLVHERGATDHSADPWWTNNAATVSMKTHASWTHSPSTPVTSATVKAFDGSIEIASSMTEMSGNVTIPCGPFVDTQKTITLKPVSAPSPMCSRHQITSSNNSLSKSMIWTGLRVVLQRIDGLTDASGDVCWTNNGAVVTPTVGLVWTHTSPYALATGAVVTAYSNNTRLGDYSNQSGVVAVPMTYRDSYRLLRIQPLRSDHGITFNGGEWNRSVIWTGLRVAVTASEGLTDASPAEWWTNNNQQVTLRASLLWSHNSKPATGGVLTLFCDDAVRKDYTVSARFDSHYVLSDSSMRHADSAHSLRISPRQADHGIVYNSGGWNQTIIWTGLKVWFDSQRGAQGDEELWTNNNAQVTLTYHLTWTHDQATATGGAIRAGLDGGELIRAAVAAGQPSRFQVNLTYSNARHLVEVSPVRSDHGITYAVENWSAPLVWTGLTCSPFSFSGTTETASDTCWANSYSPVVLRVVVRWSHDSSLAKNVTVGVRCDSQRLTTLQNLTGGVVTAPTLTYADVRHTFEFQPIRADRGITCSAGNYTVDIVWTGIRLVVDVVNGPTDESSTELWVPDDTQVSLRVHLVWSHSGQNASGGTISLWRDGVWVKDLAQPPYPSVGWSILEPSLRGTATQHVIQLTPKAGDHGITYNSGGWSWRVTWTSVALSLSEDQRTPFDEVWTDVDSEVRISIFTRYLYDPRGGGSPTLREHANCSVTDGLQVGCSAQGVLNFSYSNSNPRTAGRTTFTFRMLEDNTHHIPLYKGASLNITWTGLGVALDSWAGLTDALSQDFWANDNDRVELGFRVFWLHVGSSSISDAKVHLTTNGTEVWLSPKTTDRGGLAVFGGCWGLARKMLKAYADLAENPRRGTQGSGPEHISYHECWGKNVTWTEVVLSLSSDSIRTTDEIWTDVGTGIDIVVQGWYRYDPNGGSSPRLNDPLSGDVSDGHSLATSVNGTFSFTYLEHDPTARQVTYTPTPKNVHGITKYRASTADLVWTAMSIGGLEIDNSDPRRSVVEVPVLWSHNGSPVPNVRVEVTELGLNSMTDESGRARFAFPDGQNYSGSLTFTAISGPMDITRCLQRQVLERHRLEATLSSISESAVGLNFTLSFFYETGKPAEDVEAVLELAPMNVRLTARTERGVMPVAYSGDAAGRLVGKILDARYLGKQIIVDELGLLGKTLFDDNVELRIEIPPLLERHVTESEVTIPITLRSLATTVKLRGVTIQPCLKGGNDTSVYTPQPVSWGADMEPQAAVVRSVRLFTVPKTLPTGNYSLVLTAMCGNSTVSMSENRTISIQRLISLVVKVRDGLGSPLPGATVVITRLGPDGNQTARLALTTDQEGSVSFRVPVGQYRVEVSATGSTSYEKTLDLGEDVTHGVSLGVDRGQASSGQNQLQLILAVAVSLLSSILILSRRRSRR